MARAPNISEYFITGVQKLFFALVLRVHKHFKIIFRVLSNLYINLISRVHKYITLLFSILSLGSANSHNFCKSRVHKYSRIVYLGQGPN